MKEIVILGAMIALCGSLSGCDKSEAAVTKLQCSDMQRNHAQIRYKEKRLNLVSEGIPITPEVDAAVVNAVFKEVVAEAKTTKKLLGCVGEVIE